MGTHVDLVGQCRGGVGDGNQGLGGRTVMDTWKKEYIQNELYRLLEMVGDSPEEEPTVESLMEQVQKLIETIKE